MSYIGFVELVPVHDVEPLLESALRPDWRATLAIKAPCLKRRLFPRYKSTVRASSLSSLPLNPTVRFWRQSAFQARSQARLFSSACSPCEPRSALTGL